MENQAQRNPAALSANSLWLSFLHFILAGCRNQLSFLSRHPVFLDGFRSIQVNVCLSCCILAFLAYHLFDPPVHLN